METQDSAIFNLSLPGYQYKGVLFAEVDIKEIMPELLLLQDQYIAGFLAIIFVDDKGIWHTKARIKFPSGNKQVLQASFEKDAKNGIDMNETYVLQKLYAFPLIHKTWCPNPNGDAEGILEIFRREDMIESITSFKIDD